jgi:hypothetical protein
MRTLPKGSNAPHLPLIPVAPPTNVPEHDVPRDDGMWRHAGATRSPLHPESATDLAAAFLAEDDETLIADVRAGVTPAEMVELKLRSLLRTRGVSIQLVGRESHFHGRSTRG